MERDLTIRLRAYATTAEANPPKDAALHADALTSSHAASSAASASIICSHTRELRGTSPPGYLPPRQDELDHLLADTPREPNAEDSTHPPWIRLPLKPGHDTLARLVQGADGIAAMKSRNG